MGKSRNILIIILWVLLLFPSYSALSEEKATEKPRTLENIQDILAWKSLRSSRISNDGKWFAYRLSPQEGDGEVIIRQTDKEKVYKYPAGEAAGFSQDIVFSEDSKWVAFTIYPKRDEAKKLKKQKKKVFNNVTLLNLESEEKFEFEKINRFVFSGENSAWLGLQKYPPETTGMPGGNSPQKDKWRGTDLILHELATGNDLNIGNVAEFAFDKKGNWLAWIVDAQEKTGWNPGGTNQRDSAGWRRFTRTC